MGFQVLDSTGRLKVVPAGLSAAAITSGVLATARGGTSVDIASAALPLGSGQIAFPAVQNSSADANTLDDYEEGTWTPIDSSGAGLAFSNVAGVYVKIGRQVWLGGRADFPVTASGANISIGGLPFTSAAAASTFWGGSFSFTTVGAPSGSPTINTSATTFLITTEAGGLRTNVQFSNTVNTWNLQYLAAA